MLRNNNLIKAGSLYMFGNLFNKAIALLMIPFLTRNMSTDEYGILNVYISWVAIFTVFIGLSLGSSFRTAFVDYKNTLNEYTSSLYLLSLLLGVFILGIVFSITLVYDFHMSNHMLMCCLIQSFFTFVLDSISIKYMMEQKYVKRTILMSIPNILVALLTVFLVLQIKENKYWGRIIPYVLIYAIFGLGILYSVFKSKTIVKVEYCKYALLYSLPLVFHALSCVILSSSDRIMIDRFRSSSESGIYSFIYNLSMAVKVITGTLESIWIPWFTRKIIENQKEKINKYVSYYIELVAFFITILMFISPEIIRFISPKEYWGGITLSIPIILASFIMFLYSISVDLEYYYKSTKYIAKNTIIAAVVNFLLNLALISKFGASAAAYTTVFAYTISFVLHYNHSRTLDKELFPFSKYLPSILIILFTSVSTYIFIDNTIVRWLMCFSCVIIYSLYFIFSERKKLIIKKYGTI